LQQLSWVFAIAFRAMAGFFAPASRRPRSRKKRRAYRRRQRCVRVSLVLATLACEKKHLLSTRNETKEAEHVT
jgi:hypothetical protein